MSVGGNLRGAVGLRNVTPVESVIPQLPIKRQHPQQIQRILPLPAMFFRFKLLALVVLVSSAIVSIQAHDGEHEHGEGVVMWVTSGNSTMEVYGANDSSATKDEPDRLPSKSESGDSDNVAVEADRGARNESRSTKRDSMPRAADSGLGDKASEGAEDESRSSKRDAVLN
jgi:hypothetical protein